MRVKLETASYVALLLVGHQTFNYDFTTTFLPFFSF